VNDDTLDVDHDDGVRILRAAGELDIAVVPAMLPGVPALVAGASGVVLDLTAVHFFDSSGVRLVDHLLRECARDGATLKVVAPPGHRARRVLEIVGMAGGLLADDLETAIEAVRVTS
jgi:anti-sigma B factor antagonist